MADSPTLAEVLKASYDQLSPAERRVSRAFMADYPIAGLEPVNRLAARANVSAPTVLRMLLKLGVGSYPDMQKLLHEEIAARTTSPVSAYADAERETLGDSVIDTSRSVIEQGISATFNGLARTEFDAIVTLLANSKHPVKTTGGRFSGLLAEYLALHLRHMRPNVSHVRGTEQERTFALLDIGSRDVVLGFDYRRYQDSTVHFLRQAKEQKATTILVTDPWLSPAAKYADLVITNAVQAASPFDSITPGFALIETLIAAVVDKLDDLPVARLRRYDAIEAMETGEPIDAEPTSRSATSSARRQGAPDK